MHVCGNIYFIGTFIFFIGTFNFIYCRNRKNQNHATSRLRKNLAVPYRKNKQNLQPTSADAVVEIFTPFTTDLKGLSLKIVFTFVDRMLFDTTR